VLVHLKKQQSRTYVVLDKRINQALREIKKIKAAKEAKIPLEDKLPRSSSFTKHLLMKRHFKPL
jgi:hypothetical protein